MARKSPEGPYVKQLREAGGDTEAANPAGGTPGVPEAAGSQTDAPAGAAEPQAPKPPKVTAPQQWVLDTLDRGSGSPMKPTEIRKAAGHSHGPDHMTLSALVKRGWISGTFTDGYEITDAGRKARAGQ